MGLATQRRDLAIPVYQPLHQLDLRALLQQAQASMRELAVDWLARLQTVDSVSELELRYLGTDVSLTIPSPPESTHHEVTSAFHAAHKQRFGYDRPTRAIELVAMRLQVSLLAEQTWKPISWPQAAQIKRYLRRSACH